MPIGYDKSDDYNGPEPTWLGFIGIVLAILAVCITFRRKVAE